jgi:hypothetical protein
MKPENLDGMTSEQLMLRDFIYEVNDILAEAEGASFDERLGLRPIAKLLEMNLQAFQIDQSRFARSLVDVDAWFAGTVK